jgi:hypothetical protein
LSITPHPEPLAFGVQGFGRQSEKINPAMSGEFLQPHSKLLVKMELMWPGSREGWFRGPAGTAAQKPQNARGLGCYPAGMRRPVPIVVDMLNDFLARWEPERREKLVRSINELVAAMRKRSHRC